jgi:putative DNA primase/helicase
MKPRAELPLVDTDINFSDVTLVESEPLKTEPEARFSSSRRQAAPPRSVSSQPHFFYTDSGNAEYFAHHYGQDVRFDHQREQWKLWNGVIWAPDADAGVLRLAKDAMRRRRHDAADIEDKDDSAAAFKWAHASESRARRSDLLYLARAELPIADTGAKWDAQPWLLACPNGTIDLRTGDARTPCREDRITLCTSIDYAPDARSDLWEDALRAILLDDDVIAFFQTAVGYAATGDTRRDVWFLANGDGRNGKGTLLQPIRQALGDYALELPGAVFDRRSERTPFELAYLPGKRFVTASEAGDTLTLHHDRIKQITGGDSMSAANKYEKAFEFDPVCKLFLSCNKPPRVTDDTAAFWARVVLVPFTVSFKGREDRALRPALVTDPAHQRAVLAWIVKGAVRYAANGLDVPDRLQTATDAFERASDPLGEFLTEACELDPDAEIGASDLYNHYRAWADAQHLSERERLNATAFGRRMSGRFQRETTRTIRVYKGIGRRLTDA